MSRIVTRSVRDFFNFQVYPLSHYSGYTSRLSVWIFETPYTVIDIPNSVPNSAANSRWAHYACPVVFQNEVFFYGLDDPSNYKRILMLQNNEVKLENLRFYKFTVFSSLLLENSTLILCWVAVQRLVINWSFCALEILTLKLKPAEKLVRETLLS